MRRSIGLLLVLAAALSPASSYATSSFAYEVGAIVLERSGPLDPAPSAPCESEASTAGDADPCTTAPGCVVAVDPLLGIALPDDPPCRLAITVALSGQIPGASGPVTLEMMGEISSGSGVVLTEHVDMLLGGPFDVDVAPDGTFTAILGPFDWRSWGAGPTCTRFSLYWVKVHDPGEPLGVPPEDPGPGADVRRCG